MNGSNKHQIVIVGGGAAGITVAASLRRKHGGADLDIAIIEPSDLHYYQPAFTLVGAGVCALAATYRAESQLIPAGVHWIPESAAGFEPDQNTVLLANGGRVSYDFLVVCPGVVLDWHEIDGLGATLGQNGVCSNYSPAFVEYTWHCIHALKPGATALFTQPPAPFKCAGAPQKIAYLTADFLRRRGTLAACHLHFLNHGAGMFAVPFFARELARIAARYGIQTHFQHKLVAVDGPAHTATFEIVGGENQGQRVTMTFDMLHVTPPQSPPVAVKSSALANAAGYVEVDQNTLRHVRYPNIFSLGDACSTTNSKTAAAVRKQAPVVVRNLLSLLRGSIIESVYDGYASCPITTAYGKVLMAEFCYGGKVTRTLPLDPRKERRSYWWLTTRALPMLYWDYMLKGREKFPRHATDWQEPAD